MQYIRALGALWMFSAVGFACQESNPSFSPRPSGVGDDEMAGALALPGGDTPQSPQQTATSADGGAAAVGGFASASAGRAAVMMSAMGGMANGAGMSAASGVPAEAGTPGDGGSTTAGMAIVGGGSAVAGTPGLGGGDTAGTSALGGGDEAGMSAIGDMPAMGGLPLTAGMPRPGGAAVAGRPALAGTFGAGGLSVTGGMPVLGGTAVAGMSAVAGALGVGGLPSELGGVAEAGMSAVGGMPEAGMPAVGGMPEAGMPAVGGASVVGGASASAGMPASGGASVAAGQVAVEETMANLFADPSSAELAAVRADWAARSNAVEGWRVEGTTQLGGFRIDVVSHVTDGYRHYGAVRFPRNYDPARQYPVVLKNHGGGNGHRVNAVRSIGNNQPGNCTDDFFIVGATYRGEELRAGQNGLAQSYQAEGPDPNSPEANLSALDGDATDVIQLLTGVLENMAGADGQRIGMIGGSRGAGVGYVVAVRDPRIRRAVFYYGASDHMIDHIFDAAVEYQSTRRLVGNPPTRTSLNVSVQPWLDGEIDFAEARRRLLIRSPHFFSEDMPPTQVHHGVLDRTVRVEHSRQLNDRMQGLGRDDFTYFEYANGEHSVNSLQGANGRAIQFLCGL